MTSALHHVLVAVIGSLLPPRTHRRYLGLEQRTGPHALQAVDDDAITGLQALGDDAQSVDGAAERDRPVHRAAVVADRHHELLVLIGADRALVDHHQRLLLRLAHAHAGELPGDETPVVVLEHRADTDRAALAV